MYVRIYKCIHTYVQIYSMYVCTSRYTLYTGNYLASTAVKLKIYPGRGDHVLIMHTLHYAHMYVLPVIQNDHNLYTLPTKLPNKSTFSMRYVSMCVISTGVCPGGLHARITLGDWILQIDPVTIFTKPEGISIWHTKY